MAEEQDGVGKRDRSPAFPYVGLEKAVELVRALHRGAKRYEVPLSTAAREWGLTATSSSTLRTAAALQAYGLADQSGSGEGRRIKVSELGWKITEDPDPTRQQRYLAQAALNPPLVAEWAEKWKEGRPDDLHALFQLKQDSNFTEEGATKFLRIFDDTKRYFPKPKTDSVFDVVATSLIAGSREKAKGDVKYGNAKVGDLVQWEAGGQLKFPEPKQVVGVHESGDWIFVEGSGTGIRMAEVIVQASVGDPARAVGTGLERPPELPQTPVGRLGEIEWLRGPLSRGTSYRLMIAGEIGPKEIGKLITLLKAQQEVLSEEDEEEDAEYDLNTRLVIDVSDFFDEKTGLYPLPAFKEGVDYRDLRTRTAITSIGRHKKSGEIFAAVDSQFYMNDEYECLWLR